MLRSPVTFWVAIRPVHSVAVLMSTGLVASASLLVPRELFLSASSRFCLLLGERDTSLRSCAGLAGLALKRPGFAAVAPVLVVGDAAGDALVEFAGELCAAAAGICGCSAGDGSTSIFAEFCGSSFLGCGALIDVSRPAI